MKLTKQNTIFCFGRLVRNSVRKQGLLIRQLTSVDIDWSSPCLSTAN